MAGNHDITLDPDFYAEHGLHFHNQDPQDPQACINLVNEYKNIIFLNHESRTIYLTREDGPRTHFAVFGSPFSPRHGLWAFGYPSEEASKLWDKIPLDTDILITHTPPKYHCDESGHRGSGGCSSLRETLWRVRPALAICGHIHEARGAERILWDLGNSNVKYKEYTTGYWQDPGANTKKQSLLDLSAISSEPLQNTGPWEAHANVVQDSRAPKIRGARSSLLAPSDPHPESAPEMHPVEDHDYPAVRGQGGIPPSGRCDLEALNGRLGRKETCVVNAAIMTSSWPYKANSGRKYNKPIVVDIDLPCGTHEGGHIYQARRT